MNRYKYRKAFLSVSVIVFLILRNFYYVLAQEVEVSPTPEPTPEVTSEVSQNTADVTNNVDSESQSGDNSIGPSTTPEATIFPTPTPINSVSGSEVTTSDSMSETYVENNVNSNVVDSVIINHTLNIFLQEDPVNIDLSVLSQDIVEKVFEEDQKGDPVVNILVNTEGNFAYVENNVISEANSGENTTEGEGSEINTGDAYSVVSVFNNVNSNIVNSVLHVVTVNIFSDLEGNIIIPEPDESWEEQSTGSSGETITANNSATVENTILSTATSGENNIISDGNGEITTSESVSSVNVLNVVNTSWVDQVFSKIYINNYGDWEGGYLGWGQEDTNTFTNSEQEQNGLVLQNKSNEAVIVNNITSTAKSGGNEISSGDGSITTGKSYSSVSLVNLINSNIIRSFGFIGFVNIFGSFKGYIGGESKFIEETADVDNQDSQNNSADTNNSSSDNGQRNPGGMLELFAKHNVGDYVLPGDTITFEVKVKNPGYDKLYETKVYIELFKDGVNYGGSYYDLGDIMQYKSVVLSTGLVLSKDAEPGDYQAVVTAEGISGPDNKLTQSQVLPFKIFGYAKTASDDFDNEIMSMVNASEGNPPSVLGASSYGLSPYEKKMITAFFSLLVVYLLGRGYQRRDVLVFPAFRKIGDYALRIGSLLT